MTATERKGEFMKIMNPGGRKKRTREGRQEGKRELSGCSVCLGDACLEMVAREMPQRTNGKEMKWGLAHLPQEVCRVESLNQLVLSCGNN